MRRHGPLFFLFAISTIAMLAAPAVAQQQGVQWQTDLETAKTLARQTNRLVLVHFWTPSCLPCLTLDQTVFNQPGVAGAIEAQFVPVKLNANENSATAQGFGISRVPTDVIITPNGEVIGKLVSPPTPAAYVAEVTQTASQHAAKSGMAFDNAVAGAPQPSQINAAYANLQIAPNTPLAVTPANSFQQNTVAPAVGANPLQSLAPMAPITSANQFLPASPASFAQPPMASPPAVPSQPVSPPPGQQQSNPYAALPVTPTLSPVTPIPPALPAASAAVYPPPQAFANPNVTQQAPSPSPFTPVGAAPDLKQLPPGAPPLGFDGFCPVSMRNSWKWVPGDPRWGIVHRGSTYWFASQTEQQQFWTDPDRYSPALSGMDPVLAVDHKQQVPGKREHSIDYDNLFYMFASEATLQQFTANPERYAVNVRQAMGIQRGRLVR